MIPPSFDLTRLPGEWSEVGASEARGLEDEARREVPRGHRLHGVAVMAVAVRRPSKDVVFWLPQVGQRAYVHLTARVESDPRWPTVVCAHEWETIVAELVDE